MIPKMIHVVEESLLLLISDQTHILNQKTAAKILLEEGTWYHRESEHPRSHSEHHSNALATTHNLTLWRQLLHSVRLWASVTSSAHVHWAQISCL